MRGLGAGPAPTTSIMKDYKRRLLETLNMCIYYARLLKHHANPEPELYSKIERHLEEAFNLLKNHLKY